jgi:3-deoxy-7-phosphoheptulonate synthase
MSLASVAAGADGLLIEVHHNPDEALCDADQALTPDGFHSLMEQVRSLRTFVEKLPATGLTPSSPHRIEETI